MTSNCPLPEMCTGQQADEMIPEYAARVLRFLLATSSTALLTDDQLVQADHAAQLTIASQRGPDGKASQLEITQYQLITILSAARHTIASVQQWRREQHRHASQPAAPLPQGGTQGGRLAPLLPPTPSLPPGGAQAPLRPMPRQQPDGIRF